MEFSEAKSALQWWLIRYKEKIAAGDALFTGPINAFSRRARVEAQYGVKVERKHDSVGLFRSEEG